MKTSRRHTQANPNVINNWLENNGDPTISKLVERNIAIADKIKMILNAKGIKPILFAEQMGKDKSEISKWLSGQHNFTMKTIVKIEEALGEDLIHIEPKERIVYMTAYVQMPMEASDSIEFNESEYALAHG